MEPVDDHDRRRATTAPGLLDDLNRLGLLDPADVHVATRLGALGGEHEPAVLLAVALAVRAVRAGSVCVQPQEAAAELVQLTEPHDIAWPQEWADPAAWQALLAASPLVEAGVLRLDSEADPDTSPDAGGGWLYLDRYHRLETQVRDDLLGRLEQPPPTVDEPALAAALTRLGDQQFSEEQRAAAVSAVRTRTTVLTGGPGTGKTTTVARMLVLLADQAEAQGQRLRLVLTAPTGKAATRLQEAVAEALEQVHPDDRARVGRPEAMTLHRLLGWRPDNSTRFRHDRTNRLPHDLVVVDETSMVDLTLMGRLLEAVRPSARLLLVGDPEQLTSVGAGAVLHDVVQGLGDRAVAHLRTNHRSQAHIRDLAEQLRAGDADAVLAVLRAGGDQVCLVETESTQAAERELRTGLVEHADALRTAALAGDHESALALLEQRRLLCAHREGPAGVRHWNRLVETWLAERLRLPSLAHGTAGGSPEWYPGRPLLVTSNDYALDVYNGETGVAVVRPGDGRLRAWIRGSDGLRDLAPGRFDTVETMHAMTIHKSQGSQAEHVTVLLPDPDSRLLTRQLLYTAVTRAQHSVRLVGTEAAVRAAVEREADRASGLGRRLSARGR
ncbi:exodeoxyribonuclease V subunit alpha [Nocardioides sp. CBS4Y-1]|uniref:RecBCD enzyme subunit RecD n=1 Tax=Nocardioides acrostichi TaxID=2784339 RepID=A0A930V4B7_9ACTN|nr:exodeoxyribonuclease V subunit alpha [Nocardioides acrostichi]